MIDRDRYWCWMDVTLRAVRLAVIGVLVFGAAQAADRPRVVITGLPPADLEAIRSQVPGVELLSATREELKTSLAGAVALINSCDPEAVRQGADLRWVQAPSAGVEGCLTPELLDRPITLTNNRIVQGPQIADHALALLLALTRNLKWAVQNQAGGQWGGPGGLPMLELRGKTALVIGLGGIGTQIAERAAAFGMRVLAVDAKDIPFINSVEQTGQPEDLHAFLPRADVVFSSVPLTSETRTLLGAREFALMKKGVFLINVSRGGVVDTPALVQALQEGRFGGVGLDVTDPEPLPAGHALWSFENVIITPHNAHRSDQVASRRLELIIDNLRRFLSGYPLRNVVDKKLGY